MQTVAELAAEVGVQAACAALSLSRSGWYRAGRVRPVPAPRTVPWALSDEEVLALLAVFHEERFVDLAPSAIYAILLEEGRYLCSIRTMYRVLTAHGEVRERRAVRTHPPYQRPELLATGPNQVWSWDIRAPG